MATNKLIIGLSGKKQSGKNTAANQIIAQYHNALPPDKRYPWTLGVNNVGHHFWTDPDSGEERFAMGGVMEDYCTLIAFADALKKFCINVLGLTHEQCYGTDAEKDTRTRIRWGGLPVRVWEKYAIGVMANGQPLLPFGPMTAREVMQIFGTDLMRAWHPSIWVGACIRKAETYAGPLVLITDVRFPDEVAAIQAIGGKVIRLLRAPHAEADQHESETALDNMDASNFDLLIPSGVTIETQGDHLRPVVMQWFIDHGLVLPATLDDIPDYSRKGK